MILPFKFPKRLSARQIWGANTLNTELYHYLVNKVGSIYHGFAVDFSVPFLVTMWCVI